MALKSLTIHGLRGFSGAQTIVFATPSGVDGSGLTILVGPNNGGKSTVVEALRLIGAHGVATFTEGKRNAQAGNRVRLEYANTDGDSAVLRTVDAGGSQTKREGQPINNCFVLPSRRYFNPHFHHGTTERDAYARQLTNESRGAPLGQFYTRLFGALERSEDFNAVLARVFGATVEWTIEQADTGMHYLRLTMGGASHNSDGAGEGLVSLFLIADALYDSKRGDTVVIDEPELSLHPALQKRLSALLEEYAKDRQIVYATHSPYFANIEAIANGAALFRIYKTTTGCVAARLGDDVRGRLRGLTTNLQNPHILGLDAREVFFLDDGVILVEGQEDVVVYRSLLKQLGRELKGEFFGWGVGGASNMGTVAAILRDLGFAKVVGLLDGNKKDLLAPLEQKFPAYKFLAIPFDDVRAKPEHVRPAVAGMTDTKGLLPPANKAEAEKIIGEVQGYLDK